ncbi:MAG TPA: phosphodiester glycosidase family protein [Solirubrobacterales bacterium]|jgi:hypothetical protein
MRAVIPGPVAAAAPARAFAHETLRVSPAPGVTTTLHVLRLARSRFRVRVARLDPLARLADWCSETGAEHALIGGFYVRARSVPLGDLWIDGRALPSEPFDAPWDRLRSCVHIEGDEVTLRPRTELPAAIAGDLLQAGPLLVRGGRSAIRAGVDPEGFSAGARQFDSDITVGRYPRAALGVNDRELIAAVCDGRTDDDSGLELGELADVMLSLGATDAINLDGGGSASLVVSGRLVNVPREEHGVHLVGGRPVPTALRFEPR